VSYHLKIHLFRAILIHKLSNIDYFDSNDILTRLYNLSRLYSKPNTLTHTLGILFTLIYMDIIRKKL